MIPLAATTRPLVRVRYLPTTQTRIRRPAPGRLLAIRQARPIPGMGRLRFITTQKPRTTLGLEHSRFFTTLGARRILLVERTRFMATPPPLTTQPTVFERSISTT